MKIAFGNDHAALEHRQPLIDHLSRLGHHVIDCGTTESTSTDYPDFAKKACEIMIRGEADRTVLICGTGIGMSIAANKIPGVRCAVVTDLYGAKMTRAHNDSNALALRGREQSIENNKKILKTWLETEFEGGRHRRRVNMLNELDNTYNHGDST